LFERFRFYDAIHVCQRHVMLAGDTSARFIFRCCDRRMSWQALHLYGCRPETRLELERFTLRFVA
jgi:hypothetical protein